MLIANVGSVGEYFRRSQTISNIRVLLAEDHTIVREGLRFVLDQEAGIEVVDEAEEGREALEKVGRLLPDILVMDIGMPVLNGLEATRQVTKQFPDVKVLILTMHASEEYIFQILRAGASAYLLKDSAITELVEAIRTVYRGDTYLSPSISTKVIKQYLQHAEESVVEDHYERLTSRERQVLQLVAEGHSSRDIAELLHISIKTVETHRANLMDKLDIHNIAGLVKYAIRKGLIGLD